ncbi:hypothetical protein WJX73_007119 [Symbiochloris irregularis]|uniref:Tryptophan-rich sensory protein n=1 Tax=Symbiochloris irregularis TaxID=706552 RepID=A0AAW1PFH6_9CHLO
MEEEKRALQAMPPWSLRISNVVGFAVLISVNGLVQSGWLGPRNSEISEKFSTPLTPAGWAFGIWGLIFALQGAGAVYSAFPDGYGGDGSKQRIVNAIGYGWQVGWYLESAWQIFFMMETPGAMWICLLLLLLALAAFGWTLSRLYRLKELQGPLSSGLLYLLYFMPTSLNTAWLSVASGLGALVVPASYGLRDHLDACAVALAITVTMAGLVIVHKYRDSAYGLTLMWAFVAVYGNQRSPSVRITALVCLAVSFMVSLLTVLRRKHHVQAGERSDMRQPLNQVTDRV